MFISYQWQRHIQVSSTCTSSTHCCCLRSHHAIALPSGENPSNSECFMPFICFPSFQTRAKQEKVAGGDKAGFNPGNFPWHFLSDLQLDPWDIHGPWGCDFSWVSAGTSLLLIVSGPLFLTWVYPLLEHQESFLDMQHLLARGSLIQSRSSSFSGIWP